MRFGKPVSALLTVVSILAWIGATQAQPGPRGGGLGRERPQGRFLEKAPQVGDPLPDLEVYDSEGRPLRLGSLQGHYTVLVLGCLT